MTLDQALAQLGAAGDPAKAKEMAQYHKVERRYLGVANPQIDKLVKDWRKALSLDQKLAVSSGLWDDNSHEARIAAAKLLDQNRFKPSDDLVWELIASWVPDFDAWAIADHASIAGQKRLRAKPARLDQVEAWTNSSHLWTKRAALVMTLPWARLSDPSAEDLAARERILGWAASYVADPEWFIQKSVAWWLRDLSKRDPHRVRAFLDTHGSDMKAFARKEAAKYLDPGP